MPRKVDHDERRRHIAEALLRVTGTRGPEAVSLREVALEAGVSMGTVQHYFATKDDMLLHALRHWLSLGVHERFTARVRARTGKRSAPADVLRALAAEYLPHDEESRAEALVAIAFVSRAALSPALAEALAPAFDGFAAALAGGFRHLESARAADEGRRLAALLDGLRLPVLVGALSHRAALRVVDTHLAEVGERRAAAGTEVPAADEAGGAQPTFSTS